MSPSFIIPFLTRYVLNKVFGRFYEVCVHVWAAGHCPVGWAASSELESKGKVQATVSSFTALMQTPSRRF
jgi:hypothetical protein